MPARPSFRTARRPRLCVAVLVTAIAGAFAPGASAALSFRPCSDTPSIGCATARVPLDRTGAAAGTIDLHVRRLASAERSRGILFLLSGGPGGAAASTFLSSSFFTSFFPEWTLVAVDARGTGRSGALRCRVYERGRDDATTRAVRAEQCAGELGDARRFYTTRAHVDDLEDVRRELGVERVAIYGASYGTKHALAYALTYPTHVDRLALESVLPVDAPDPLVRSMLAALPGALRSMCAGGSCRGVVDPAADFVDLADRLAHAPLQGTVLAANGERQPSTLDRRGLLEILIAADLDPFTRSTLPAAVQAALRGDARPILRIAEVHRSAVSAPDPGVFSLALSAATMCEDGPFGWSRDTPVAEREAAWLHSAELAAADVPPTLAWAMTLHPFGQRCLRWPHAPQAPQLGEGPLPDVPVLALGGDVDLRTPALDTIAVAARFPRGRALVVPGAGHAVSAVSPCAQAALAAFLRDQALPQACPRVQPPLSPSPVPPRTAVEVEAAAGYSGRVGRTLTAAAMTVDDAAKYTMASAVSGRPVRLGGLRGGVLDGFLVGAVLRRYSFVPGVWVSGNLTAVYSIFGPARLEGEIRVGGPAAVAGVLHVGEELSGRLGDTRVRLRVRRS